MSTMKVDSIVSSGGTNTAQINGITPALASQAEAEAGTDNTKLMTPLRLRNALNATGSAPTYACRAWVNFNGTGTVAIRASGNVTSITDNGAGNYTVNFATAMPDANYCWTGSGRANAGGMMVSVPSGGTVSTSQLNITTIRSDNSAQDFDYVTLAIFR